MSFDVVTLRLMKLLEDVALMRKNESECNTRHFNT